MESWGLCICGIDAGCRKLQFSICKERLCFGKNNIKEETLIMNEYIDALAAWHYNALEG